MNIFSTLLGKIFGAATPAVTGTPNVTTPAGKPVIDITSYLDGLAAKNSESLDWKHSIVDLLKLVAMDSSLTARKHLAAELNYTGDTEDSASLNIWLHKEVLTRLAANGGNVPAELLT